MAETEVPDKKPCKASNVKNDNYKFENKVGKSYYDLCCTMAIEDAEYILMHCPTLDDTMNQVSQKINDLEMSTNTLILSDGRDTLATLMDNVSNDKNQMYVLNT